MFWFSYQYWWSKSSTCSGQILASYDSRGEQIRSGRHLCALFLIGSEPEVLFLSVGVRGGRRHRCWLYGLIVSSPLGDSSDICAAGPAKSTQAPRVGARRWLNQKCITNRMSDQHAKATCRSKGGCRVASRVASALTNANLTSAAGRAPVFCRAQAVTCRRRTWGDKRTFDTRCEGWKKHFKI